MATATPGTTPGPTVSLDELVKEALQKNSAVQSALHVYQAKLDRVPQVKSLPDPKLGVGWMGNIQPFSVQTGDPSSYRDLQVMQEIPFPGKLGLRDDFYRAFGVDLTEVPGINSLTAQMLLTEIGPDLLRFPTAAAFCFWLRLCSDPKISGGQVLSSRTRPTKNRAALALRMATQGLHRSDTFLGDYFRRMKARMGVPKAMTATAHKLARIVYHMITTQQEYDATIFGFHLVPMDSVP